MTTCSICPEPAVETRVDCIGDEHRACIAHQEYLEGWLQDVEHEARCDERAMLDFEHRAYGRD